MKQARRAGLALALLAPGACGTIDQAPLVYVSTIKVGVSAEGGTAAVPGAKVILGVDATDAAFVPVAAGRTCVVTDAQSCEKAPITSVGGNNNVSATDVFTLARLRTKTLGDDIATLKAEQGTLAGAEAALTQAQAADARRTASRTALNQLPAGPADGLATDPYLAQRNALNAAMGAESAIADQVTTRLTARDAARQAVDAAQAKLVQSQAALDGVLGTAPGEAGLRNDALSVYGSFNTGLNGGVNGGAPSASLNLGKSFSTGIAAQLLTEGIRNAATRRAVAECYTAAAKAAEGITPDADKQKLLRELLALCKLTKEES